jgi:hypothetical protein
MEGFFLFGLWDYWHCGHSWPIVPASDDSKDDCGEQMECRLAGETEVLGENLPQRHLSITKSHMPRSGFEPRTAAVGSRRLTAWAMARPNMEGCSFMFQSIILDSKRMDWNIIPSLSDSYSWNKTFQKQFPSNTKESLHTRIQNHNIYLDTKVILSLILIHSPIIKANSLATCSWRG